VKDLYPEWLRSSFEEELVEVEEYDEEEFLGEN